MRRSLAILAVLSLVAALAPLTLAAGGSQQPRTNTDRDIVVETPEQVATELYNQGISSRNRAWKLEKKAATATPEQRQKLERKIAKAYEAAIGSFTKALQNDPQMYQAYSDLGYAYRKTGDFETSLAAYNEALSIKPNYPQAVEYRAEAFLALNRLEDAKESYIQLFAEDRKLANQLLDSMKGFVDKRRTEPQGLDESSLSSFAEWVETREQIAQQTASLRTGDSTRRDW